MCTREQHEAGDWQSVLTVLGQSLVYTLYAVVVIGNYRAEQKMERLRLCASQASSAWTGGDGVPVKELLGTAVVRRAWGTRDGVQVIECLPSMYARSTGSHTEHWVGWW